MNNFKVKKYFSKFGFVLFSFVFILQSSFARDVTELEVEKKDSWQEKFDINLTKRMDQSSYEAKKVKFKNECYQERWQVRW